MTPPTTDKAKLLHCILCALLDITGGSPTPHEGKATSDKAKLLKCILCEFQSFVPVP